MMILSAYQQHLQHLNSAPRDGELKDYDNSHAALPCGSGETCQQLQLRHMHSGHFPIFPVNNNT